MGATRDLNRRKVSYAMGREMNIHFRRDPLVIQAVPRLSALSSLGEGLTLNPNVLVF